MKENMEPFYRRDVEQEILITDLKQVVKAKTINK